MYVESTSRILLTAIAILALSACGGGGGGGGGGGSLVAGNGGQTAGASTGTISLSISGMVDENGNADNVLAGNEVATLTATVTENGSAADLTVLFSTTIGRLLQSSAQTAGGEASVQIEGTGVAGAATVTASATLSDGTAIETSITVQTSADSPNINLYLSDNSEATSVELLAAQTETLTARVLDWNNTPLEGINVGFEAEAVTLDKTAGVTDASGEVTITLTGTETQTSGTLDVSATFGSFALSDSITANSLGVDTAANQVSIDSIDAGADGVLDGNERATVSVTVLEDGAGKDGVSVTLAITTGTGTLVPDSATTAGGGLATVELIGAGEAGTVEITASATLTNGIAVMDVESVQTTAEKPTISLVARNQSGTPITSFGANQELTLEASVFDHDGGQLSTADAGLAVTFDIGGLGTVANETVVTARNVCPVNLIQVDEDCAFVELTSNATAAVAAVVATATINGIMIEDTITLTNTGVNSGSPDQ